MSCEDTGTQQHGSSAYLCDYILRHQLGEIQPLQVVDFGAGGGKNGEIARQVLAEKVRLTAIEGCEKTVDMLSGRNLYDEVYCSLIQNWVLENSRNFDLAIFGDVLEHLTPSEIHQVLGRCLRVFRHVIIVCPLHEIFQDMAHGNPLEVHKTYITASFFDRYKLTEKHIVKGREYTIMNVHIISERESATVPIRLLWLLFHNTMLVLQPFGLAKPLVKILKRNCGKYKSLMGR